MKKNQKDQSKINEGTENETPLKKTKKRSSELFRGLIYFFSFIILLIVSTGVILEFFSCRRGAITCRKRRLQTT
jgi:hypothetical protein